MKVFKKILPYLLIVVLVFLIRIFLATPVIVSGTSMNPTLLNNDILFLNKLKRNYKRFDIVVIDYKNDKVDEKLVKRIIGLPGEKIRYTNGNLYVNDKLVKDVYAPFTDDFNMSLFSTTTIPEGEYLVLGDNRANSLDSRRLGLIKKEDIKGTADFRLFHKFGKIE